MKNLKIQTYLYTTKKSFWWFILMLVFGLHPVWIIGFTNLFLVETSFSYEKIFLDGGILSFSIALIFSLTIDHFFFEFEDTSYSAKFLFSIFPRFIFWACVILLVLCYLTTGEYLKGLDIEAIIAAELIILVVTAIYAIIIKWDSFNKCEFSYNHKMKE